MKINANYGYAGIMASMLLLGTITPLYAKKTTGKTVAIYGLNMAKIALGLAQAIPGMQYMKAKLERNSNPAATPFILTTHSLPVANGGIQILDGLYNIQLQLQKDFICPNQKMPKPDKNIVYAANSAKIAIGFLNLGSASLLATHLADLQPSANILGYKRSTIRWIARALFVGSLLNIIDGCYRIHKQRKKEEAKRNKSPIRNTIAKLFA